MYLKIPIGKIKTKQKMTKMVIVQKLQIKFLSYFCFAKWSQIWDKVLSKCFKGCLPKNLISPKNQDKAKNDENGDSSKATN